MTVEPRDSSVTDSIEAVEGSFFAVVEEAVSPADEEDPCEVHCLHIQALGH